MSLVVASTLYARRVRRYDSERAAAMLDSAGGTVLGAFATVAVLALVGSNAAPLNDGLAVAFPAGGWRFVGTVSVAALFAGLLAGGILVCYVPLAFALVTATETDRTAPELLGRLARPLLVYALVLTPLLTVRWWPQFGLAALLATLAALRALWHLLSPQLVRFTHRTRPLREEERERLEAASAAVEFEPHAVSVLDSERSPMLGMSYFGIPGRRTVLVAEQFLSNADESQLRVALSHLDAICRTRVTERRTAILSGGLLGCAFLLSPLSPLSAFGTLLALAALAAGVVAGLWRLSAILYRADRVTADRVGARELLALFEWWLDECGQPESTHGRLATVLTSQPPQDRRLDRLRERADDPAEPDGQNPAD
ncbi:hypothetical protein EGH22_11500 [Halomicroarcula sp. F28]|uniref:hypothetical protein n=1 Tax=Haloarcula salinisoli TaxID=2487746 RepID=UPI001C72C4EC|nr:hypothetical protein [Halomicroarcula salinisoli]MBX0286956.1 hypothetical protein [Halomicroarcula salinisoli]